MGFAASALAIDDHQAIALPVESITGDHDALHLVGFQDVVSVDVDLGGDGNCTDGLGLVLRRTGRDEIGVGRDGDVVGATTFAGVQVPESAVPRCSLSAEVDGGVELHKSANDVVGNGIITSNVGSTTFIEAVVTCAREAGVVIITETALATAAL